MEHGQQMDDNKMSKATLTYRATGWNLGRQKERWIDQWIWNRQRSLLHIFTSYDKRSLNSVRLVMLLHLQVKRWITFSSQN